MVEQTVSAMDAPEITAFLETQETGVLSLAADSDTYAVPISFTYESDRNRIYFRLGYAPGSQKREYVAATDHATFVVYDRTPDGWKSVVANGRLVDLSDSDLDANVVEAMETLSIPFFSVFDRPAEDLEFAIVSLEVESLDGLVEGG
jgi:nitroimidazol reductase NimA-like FMN-containing flavoprotein (pyridoxamine 5'-phosphate oxidase superfamily)